MISPGVVISGALVENSVVSPNVQGALVGARRGLGADGGRRRRPARGGPQRDHRQERDRPEGAQIGVDLDRDRKLYTVSDSGIVVIGKGQQVEL